MICMLMHMCALQIGVCRGTRGAVPDLEAASLTGTIGVGPRDRSASGFLERRVWGSAKGSLLQHDAFSCQDGRFLAHGEMRTWPSKRVGGAHVGSIHLDKYATVREDAAAALLRCQDTQSVCQPVECRDRGPRVAPSQPLRPSECKVLAKGDSNDNI